MNLWVRAWTIVLLGTTAVPGCVNREIFPLDQKECPCADGFACVDGRCVQGAAPQDSGTTPSDSGGGDAAFLDGAAADAGSDAADAGSDAADAGSDANAATRICLEAEASTIAAPMEVSTQSGEMVVGVPGPMPILNMEPTSSSPRMTFDLNVSSTGTYRIWGRVIAPTTDDDSFWVRVDDGAWNRWNELSMGASGSNLKWDQFHDDQSGIVERDFTLDSGSHTIDVHFREDGVFLDKLLVTDELAFTPSGEGPCS